MTSNSLKQLKKEAKATEQNIILKKASIAKQFAHLKQAGFSQSLLWGGVLGGAVLGFCIVPFCRKIIRSQNKTLPVSPSRLKLLPLLATGLSYWQYIKKS